MLSRQQHCSTSDAASGSPSGDGASGDGASGDEAGASYTSLAACATVGFGTSAATKLSAGDAPLKKASAREATGQAATTTEEVWEAAADEAAAVKES